MRGPRSRHGGVIGVAEIKRRVGCGTSWSVNLTPAECVIGGLMLKRYDKS